MTVYEVKNPAPLPRPGLPREREDLRPVDGLAPVERIGRFIKEWSRRKGQGYTRSRGARLASEEEQDVRNMVLSVNNRLNQQGVLIHLALVEGKDGYSLDIYDCTDEISCRIVRDLEIDISELPALMRNLYEESGLLVDTRT